MDSSTQAGAAFAPVPVRPRRHGWTPERQRLFIDLLRSGREPAQAARAVGLSRESAYRLRVKKGAESFAAALGCRAARPLLDDLRPFRSDLL